MMQKEAVPYYF